MDSSGAIWPALLLVVSSCAFVATGSPIVTSTINCDSGSDQLVGAVDEGYTGDVELLTGIPAEKDVRLVSNIFPEHLQFLELSFTPGDTNATVRTRMPLDADVLARTDGILFYSVTCDASGKINNKRKLTVNDLNDNGPVFQLDSAWVNVSETHQVDTAVIQVTAVDGDVSVQNKTLTYSFAPPSEDFVLTNSGTFILKRRLNYNVAQKYNFVVTARDKWGLNDSADLLINVVDFDNMNPTFSQNLYQALIPENQIGVLVQPEAIQAEDGDKGIDVPVTYRISAVSPEKYLRHFVMNSSSGVISVVNAFDREDMNSSVISVSIKAAQTDDSLKTADSVVSVTVQDENDNPPEFDQPQYSVQVLENSPINAVVFRATVTDRDQGGFVGTLQISPESAHFSIDSDGTVRVKNSTALDREASERITFRIMARETNSPNREEISEVTVTLLDENDNSPEFTGRNYEGKVFANQTEGMLLVQVEAEDPDAGVNGQIKYFIDFGNNDGYFSINESTGDISLAKTVPLVDNRILDFPLYVTARDGGTPSRSSSTQVNIRAPGNSKPQFLQKVYRGTVTEEQEPEVFILKVGFLTTGEPPVTLQVQSEADKFSISNTGELTTRVKLDYDEAPHNYSVEISISDGVHSDSAVVEVQVTDVNDNSPVFSSSSVTKSVPEDAEVGSNVSLVAATDKDSSFNQEIRYWLRAAEGRFSVDPVSGMVSVAGALDRETKAEYELLLVAEDQGRPARSATATLLVQVSDVNDNVPEFSASQYQAVVLETVLAGTSLLTLSAVDPDQGQNGNVSYSIFQQSPPSDPAVFELDPSSGTLRLVRPLDYSEVKVYSLTVQASDGGTPSLVGNSSVEVKVVDVNNNPPEFSQRSYDVEVSENLAGGASILSLEVTDRDEGGFMGTLRILSESAPFSISPDGTIRVKNSTALDREATQKILFQVEAREAEPPNHVAVASVNVTLLDENDNSPEFISNNYTTKVFSNQTDGMKLLKVEAEDPDAGQNGRIKYSIEFGNQNNFFSIDEETGDVSLTKLIPLEPHKTLQFLLFITARDGGVVSRSASAQVEILAVGNSTPQFTQSVYSSTIEEEKEPGTMILKVGFLTTGEPPVTLQVQSEADKFSISNTGELTTRVKLDYDEAPHNYSVEISISDGVHSDSAVVEVQVTDVNDNSPVFSSSSVTKSVPEDAEVGSNVSLVAATDKDSSFNQEIRYWLRAAEGRFSVDPVSGMVSVAGALDRETKAEYELLLVAEDQGRPARSATATLLVQVSDVNDNVPEFSASQHQAVVLETALAGTSLLTLSAVDPDQGQNGNVSYSIFQQSPPSDPAVFELDPSSGTLRLVRPLDYSEVKVYSLTVQASDGGTPSLVGNSSVEVKVVDVNNNPPEFSQRSYDVEVSENLAGGASILSLEVTDRDEGGFSEGFFLYNNDTFHINSQGVVSLRTDVTLDREAVDNYVLQVLAVDQLTDGLTAAAQLNVTVLDYNDNAPQFPMIPDLLPVPEGRYSEETPAEVFAVVPTDADVGPNGEVVLSLPSPHPLFRFREDGMLLAVGPLDRESRDSYDLVVKASDRGRPQRENVTVVSLRITDVNDNKPEFSSDIFVSSFLIKDAEDGKLLLNLTAEDRDTGDNARITYSFSEGGSPYLALNGETGAVTLTSDLAGVTEDTTLELTVMAEDHGSPPLSSTAQLVVNMRLVSLVDAVAFWSPTYNFSIRENEAAGVKVGVVWASSGSHLYNVTYALKTHTDLFSVGTGGAIVAKAPLDMEKQEWYILDVEAVDTRSPPTSATAVVQVQVEDVNEPPRFSSEVYKASVFSVAPYKSPVTTVKAADPDAGDDGRLDFSLSAESPHLDVDPSSGLVYVVSVAGLAGQTVTVEVKASDRRGLQATAQVEVSVRGVASSSDVVTISISQPANIVEKKGPELEKSLASVLGWTVNIVQVWSSNGGSPDARTVRTDVRTLVSFFAEDGGKVVSSEEVTKKLQSQSAAVRAELVKLFGEELNFDIELTPQSSASNQVVVIALGVLLALSIVGLIVTVALIIRFKKLDKHQDSDRESFDFDQKSEGYSEWPPKNSDFSEQRRTEKDKQQRTDKETDGHDDSIKDKNEVESQTSL